MNLLALYIAVMLLPPSHAPTERSSIAWLYPVQSKAVRWQQCIDSKECAATNQIMSKFVVHWRLVLFFIDHCIQQAGGHVLALPFCHGVTKQLCIRQHELAMGPGRYQSMDAWQSLKAIAPEEP